MYINTSSKAFMELSVCEALNINKEELSEILETCYNMFQKDHHVFIIDNQYDYFFDYVKNHLCKEIDQVLFIHLSRRLDKCNDGKSLKDVLISDTILSSFLKNYGISFKYDEYIRLFIDDCEIDLNELNNYTYEYLKERFSHDYSFKGYMFNQCIDEHINGPELLGYLDYFKDISDDFIDKSIFYQFDYLVPLDKVYFDNYDELSDIDKQYHIVVKVLQRLYFDKYDSQFNDDDNEVMGIVDDYLEDKYLLNKSKL